MSLKVIEANRRVHSSLLLSGEYQKSPHRNPESIQRVRSILSGICRVNKPIVHLDVGCGDGFIFECKPADWLSYGIDATPEMLKVCAANHPEAKLQLAYAEKLPFPDAFFDVVTCYSFLDHLESTGHFYSEAMRILKPNGVFYFGLNPNRDFNLALMRSPQFKLSEILMEQVDLALEYQKAFDDGAYYEKNFGINKHDLALCEPGKSITAGLSSLEERTKLENLSISQIKIEYEWVFQQNRLDADVVKNLVDFLPFTSACFKYFDVIGIK